MDVDPQEINVTRTGKDSCTVGLINILSYDMMNRRAKELIEMGFSTVIMVSFHLCIALNLGKCMINLHASMVKL